MHTPNHNKKLYLNLKKYITFQNGGERFVDDICSKRIHLAQLKINDVIEFTIATLTQDPVKFDVTSCPSGDPTCVRLVSQNKNEKRESLLVIDLHPTFAKLNFVRGGTGIYTFSNLKSIFMCIAAYFNLPEMTLDDDATFTHSEYNGLHYRAIMFRVFTGKDSLYMDIENGFFPKSKNDEYVFGSEKEYTLELYKRDKQLMYESTLEMFMPYLEQYQTAYKLNYEEQLSKRPTMSKPFVLDKIENIKKSFLSFGLDKNTRNYVGRLMESSSPHEAEILTITHFLAIYCLLIKTICKRLS